MFNLKMDLPKDKPIVEVRTTHNRGFTPEEIADKCIKKIISISNVLSIRVFDRAN